ncbi:MAG: endonuclease NucS [Myxococcaceae bacterium]
MQPEARIRDHLARNLDLIEPGLTLIEAEFKLPNPAGAKGFIDILARDRLGHLVVIELKRSDEAARAALHELHKYLALLRGAHGVEPHQVRCMVCSTHWHELLVPFSEYARTVEYPVEGRQIELDREGVPVGLRAVQLLPEQQGIELSTNHVIMLYEAPGAERQVLASQLIAEKLRGLGVADFVLVRLSKESNAARQAATHAVYVAIGRLSDSEKVRLGPVLGLDTIDDEADADESPFEDARWRWEDAVIERATIDVPRDQFEIGYPEKLMQILNDQNWKVDGLERSGRFRSDALLPDRELLASLQGLRGENSVFYTFVASPRYRASWETAKANAARGLYGNREFDSVFRWFMRETESRPDASVSGFVFNPQNIVLGIWQWVTKNDVRRQQFLTPWRH